MLSHKKSTVEFLIIGEIDDKDTVFKLVDILNTKEDFIQELINEKECLATFIMKLGYTIISNEKEVVKITKEVTR